MAKQLSTSVSTSGSDLHNARMTAQLYARVHLKELAGDLVSLSAGTLGADSRLEALTQLCSKLGSGQARNCAVSMVNAELRDHVLAQPDSLDVDDLAQEIRRVDGSHSLGAGALAEALMPFLAAHSAGAVAPAEIDDEVTAILHDVRSYGNARADGADIKASAWIAQIKMRLDSALGAAPPCGSSQRGAE